MIESKNKEDFLESLVSRKKFSEEIEKAIKKEKQRIEKVKDILFVDFKEAGKKQKEKKDASKDKEKKEIKQKDKDRLKKVKKEFYNPLRKRTYSSRSIDVSKLYEFKNNIIYNKYKVYDKRKEEEHYSDLKDEEVEKVLRSEIIHDLTGLEAEFIDPDTKKRFEHWKIFNKVVHYLKIEFTGLGIGYK